MNTTEAAEPRVRPYFLPEGIDFDTLPEAVKVAFETIVEPAYSELVLGAGNALERALGATFSFLLAEEVLNHFEIGHKMNLTQTQLDADREARDKAMARFLKLLGAKNAALHALIRIRHLPPVFRFPAHGE